MKKIILFSALMLSMGGIMFSQNKSDTKKALVAVFSRADENYGVGYVTKGNTMCIAEIIAAETGAELFQIETIKPYPAKYKECTDAAKKEQQHNARPALKGSVADMSKYDVIYLGYPNWWGTMPMAVFTFLESYDFAGKTIIPFCTHEGSGLGRSENDVKKLAPKAIVRKGLAIFGSAAQKADSQVKSTVKAWLKGIL